VADHPVDEVVIGGFGKGLTLLERVSPRLVDAALLVGGVAFRTQHDDRPPAPDNLFEPLDEAGATHGRWHPMSPSSWYTASIGLHRTATQLAVVALVASLALLVRGRRSA
jgi:hypothetical protein